MKSLLQIIISNSSSQTLFLIFFFLFSFFLYFLFTQVRLFRSSVFHLPRRFTPHYFIRWFKITSTFLASAFEVANLPSRFKVISTILGSTFVFCLLSFVFISCSSPSDTSTGVTFSGRVVLEDTTDYSGVKVSLYEPVELDTALVRINQEYPNIGVHISQETEFDHREHTPVYTTTTDKNGNWKIENVEPGTYNVVAEKEGWGWRYVLETQNTSIETITLYREEKLGGLINTDLLLKQDHHYIVTDNLILAEGKNLTIEAGVWIRFDGFYFFEVYSAATVLGNESNFVHIVFNSIGRDLKWRFLKFNNVDKLILRNIIIVNSNDGVKIFNGKNILIESSLFRNELNTGILLNQSSEINIFNILIENSDQGILVQSCENVNIKNNLLIKNNEGIKLEYSNILINNNYFKENKIGLNSQFRPSSIIQNNVFKRNNYGVKCAGSDPSFLYNHFDSNNISIFVGVEYNSVNSKPKINWNNLLNNKYGIWVKGGINGPNLYDINAKSNWWGTTSDKLIERLIYDKKDAGKDSIYIGNVIYKPYELKEINLAGIK